MTWKTRILFWAGISKTTRWVESVSFFLLSFFFLSFSLSNNYFIRSRLKISIASYFIVNVAYERHLSSPFYLKDFVILRDIVSLLILPILPTKYQLMDIFRRENDQRLSRQSNTFEYRTWINSNRSFPKNTSPFLRLFFLQDLKAFDHFTQSDEEDRSWEENQYTEYGDYAIESSSYRPWYSNALWPILTVIVVTIVILLLIAHVAITVAKRRGRSPVIRPPMILRQGLVDNKNCGLVYKPLQEEIATPHMPKRGSFYSSSTFHYDKIVPESV